MMNRTIRVTSDRENALRNRLIAIGREKECLVQAKYKISSTLFSDIFFSPMDNNRLGTFYSDGKYIVLNEELINQGVDYTVIENIFLHELSHAVDFMVNGSLTGHSAEFRSYCDFLGVDKTFDKAKIKSNMKKLKTLETKIEKLIALSSSPFENEAMIALAKAQKLMIETNKSNRSINEEKLYISELYESKKIQFYITSITNFISKATGVFIVRCNTNNEFVLRVYGDLQSVEFSLYLFDYILDNINKEVSKLRKNGEHITKNSFVMGAIPEMEAKLFNIGNDSEKALAIIKRENRDKAQRLVFSERLRTIKYGARVLSKESYNLGSNFAKNLNLPTKVMQKKIT